MQQEVSSKPNSPASLGFRFVAFKTVSRDEIGVPGSKRGAVPLSKTIEAARKAGITLWWGAGVTGGYYNGLCGRHVTCPLGDLLETYGSATPSYLTKGCCVTVFMPKHDKWCVVAKLHTEVPQS